jgi:hypothetical protein
LILKGFRRFAEAVGVVIEAHGVRIAYGGVGPGLRGGLGRRWRMVGLSGWRNGVGGLVVVGQR